MVSVAITGGIGSGKSVAGDYLKNKGYKVIDADEVSRLVVAHDSKGLRQLVFKFGTHILSIDGSLDRKKLAEIVFNDKDKLQILNSITHPLIAKNIQRQIDEIETENKDSIVFVMIPLLFELNWHTKYDKVWLILAENDKRAERAAKRDSTTKDKIYNRIKNQINYAENAKYAHNVLYNNNTLESFYKQIEDALKDLYDFCGKENK